MLPDVLAAGLGPRGLKNVVAGRAAQGPRLTGLLVCLLLMTACSGYQLRGKVVEGSYSAVTLVDADDPRLAQPGLSGATVTSILDPREMGQKRLPTATTTGGGEFTVPVGEPGAGLLQYTVQVVGRKGGYQSAEETFALPGRGKRVLITLQQGRDTYTPQPGEVLEETIRMGQPYMRE